MKKLLQDVLAPVCLFSIGILLIGCDQAKTLPSQESENNSQEVEKTSSAPSELKSGNMFYIIHDVADFQMNANQYIEQLQTTQQEIQSAIDQKDQSSLTTSTQNLKQQLTNFNQALEQLNLKSLEIDQIRQRVIATNEQVLNSSYLNGQINFSEADFKKIEQQMGNIQLEMLKLAQMLMQDDKKSTINETE